MRSRHLQLLLLAAIPLAVISSGQATVWRVERDGSGDFTTIQPAVDAAASGDTVLIGPGLYQEFGDFQYHPDISPGDTYVGVSQEELTLMGTHRDSVVIGPDELNFQGFWPKGIVMVEATAKRLRVENLTLQNLNEGMRLYGNATIAGCAFKGCNSSLDGFGSGGLMVRDCTFVDARSHGIFTFSPARDIEVVDCRFVGNRGGASFAATENANVRDCVFDGGRLGIQFGQGSTGVVTRSSINAMVRNGIRLTLQSTATLSDNIISGGEANIGVSARSHIDAMENTFENASGYSIEFFERSTGTLRDNHISLDGTAAVFLKFYGQPSETILIDMRENYWGTTDVDTIAAHIHDGHDEAMNAFVEFEPVLVSPVPIDKQSVGGIEARYGGRQ